MIVDADKLADVWCCNNVILMSFATTSRIGLAYLKPGHKFEEKLPPNVPVFC